VTSLAPPEAACSSAPRSMRYSRSGVTYGRYSTRGLSPSTQRASSGLADSFVSPSKALTSLPKSCERASGWVNITAMAGEPSNRRALQSASAKGCSLPTGTRLGALSGPAPRKRHPP
jgi:hypothetical protein